MELVSVGGVPQVRETSFIPNEDATEKIPAPERNRPQNEKHAYKTYDGLTAEQWKDRIRSLGPGVPGSAEAVVGLTELVGDREAPALLRSQAALMLGRIGRPSFSAIPTLERLLAEPDRGDHTPALWGAKALSLLGPASKGATPALRTTLYAKESSRETRLACVEGLAQIGGHHAKTIPTLIELLRDSVDLETPDNQLELRRAAADALMLIGPLASIAVPTLIEFADHPDELLRAKAVGALGAIGPGAVSAAPTIAERLVFDEVDDVRKRAAFALGRLGSEVSELLLNLAEDEETEVRRLTLSSIAELARLTPDLEQSIAAALRDPQDAVRLESARTSVRHGLFRSECLHVGVTLLFSKDRTVSVGAAKLLEQLEPARTEIETLLDPEQLAANPRARGLLERVLRNASDR